MSHDPEDSVIESFNFQWKINAFIYNLLCDWIDNTGNNKPINVSYNGLGTKVNPNSKDL